MAGLPHAAGATFKTEHFGAIRAARQPVGFFEVHAENYMGAGGRAHAELAALRGDYALSIHGVGLSIGSAGPLDKEHLARVKAVCARHQPDSFSEHLAWSTHDSAYFNDLLPLPYTRETLARVVAHVDEIQTALGRRMLLENPATYVLFAESDIPETAFMDEIACRTGCGLLLDVNNVFVSAMNHLTDPRAYLSAFPLERVGEIHLAGHDEVEGANGDKVLIDAHGSPVADPVWTLYAEVIARTGPVATLVEWDNDVPSWDVLKREALLAQDVLDAAGRRAA